MVSLPVFRNLALYFAASAVGVLAQEAAGGVTVETLIDLATARNSSLLAARERVAEARGARLQAGLGPNPAVELGMEAGALTGSRGESTFSVGLAHTLELGGKRGRRVDAGTMAVALAEAEAGDAERELRWAVRTRFVEVLAARRNLEACERMLELNERSLQIARARAEAGEGAPLERSLLEVEGNRLKADRWLSAGQLERALAELKALAGMRLDDPLAITGALAPPRVRLPLEEILDAALASRADLAAARVQIRLAQAEERAARSEAVPNLIVSGRFLRSTARFDQYGLAAPGGPVTPLRDTDRTLGAGVSIDLPLRNRNQGAVQAAVARVRRTRFLAEEAERAVRTQVAAAFQRYQAARGALDLFDEAVVRQSEEHLQVLRQAYDLGEIRLLDVLSEQRRLVETQKTYTEILKETALALADLERAAGRPLF